jgi:hypothetical protein
MTKVQDKKSEGEKHFEETVRRMLNTPPKHKSASTKDSPSRKLAPKKGPSK